MARPGSPITAAQSIFAVLAERSAVMRKEPVGAAVYGIDLGKNRFDVVGCDAKVNPSSA